MRVTPYHERRDRMHNILAAISNRHRVRPEDIMGPRRFAEISRARGEVCYALFKDGVSLSEIGRFLNKDHTSIRTAVAKHAEYLERRNGNGGSGNTGGGGDISLHSDGDSS